MHAINQTLLVLLDNQEVRTAAAFEGLREEFYQRSPGHDCNSIRAIGEHLLGLRRFQLTLLGSPLADRVPMDHDLDPMSLLDHLVEAAGFVREAIETHDPDDWFAVPHTPREGRWGDEPTINRFVRPFNDFVNHLGAIRAIRRQFGNGAERTQ